MQVSPGWRKLAQGLHARYSVPDYIAAAVAARRIP